MTQQEILKEARTRFNMSQDELAKFLRTTRSQIAMAEAGQRPLSDISMQRLQSLIACSMHAQRTPLSLTIDIVDEEERAEVKLFEKLSNRLTEIEFLQFKYKLKYTAVVKDYSDLMAQANSIAVLIDALTAGNSALPEVAYFSYKQCLISQKFITCGNTAQSKILLKLDLLSAEAVAINKNLTDMSKIARA